MTLRDLACRERCSHTHSCHVHTAAAIPTAVMCTPPHTHPQLLCTHHHSRTHSCCVHTTAAVHTAIVCTPPQPHPQLLWSNSRTPSTKVAVLSPVPGSHPSVSICGAVYSGHFTDMQYVGTCAWHDAFKFHVEAPVRLHPS